MNWLVGYTLASMAGAFIVVRIFDYLFAGVVGWFISPAKLGLFVSTWTAITTGSAMRDFNKRLRHLRDRFKTVQPEDDPVVHLK
jgi:hypothetical protein